MKNVLTKKVKENILNKIGAYVRDQAKRNCPVDNGLLRNSIQYELKDENTVRIFTDYDYATFVEYGTGVWHTDEEGSPDPHSGWDIVPKNAKALRFETGRKKRYLMKFPPSKANIVYAKKVHIEGARAQPFMRPALHQSIPVIKEIIASEL